MINTVEPKEKDSKFYNVFTAIFVTALVIAPLAASKFIAIGPLIISGATLVFPITFIFNDILTEVYGYKRARRIIWTGMACSIFSALIFFIVGVLPAPDFYQNQDAYMAILGVAPRIVFASLVAYFFSEFTNSFILSKMKYWHEGKRGLYQSGRFIFSTLVGEFVDSALFITIAFYGVLPTQELLITIASIWIAKTLYEIVALPITVPLTNTIKRIEKTDTIDFPESTNYNPFSVFSLRYQKEIWS